MERWLDVAETALRAVQPGLPEMDQARCLPARHRGVGCSSCQDVCPRHALGDAAVPKPDAYACDGCGACLAACPTSALKSAALEAAIAAWLSAIAGSTGRAAVVRCEKAAGEPEVEAADGATGDDGAAHNAAKGAANTAALTLPCLAALRPAEIVAARARGAAEISIVSADCAACDRALAGQAFEAVVNTARAALVAMQVPASITRSMVPGDSADGRKTGLPERRVSRRGLFTLWQSTAQRAALEVARENEAPAGFVGRWSPPPRWRQRLEADVMTLAWAGAPPPGTLPVEIGAALPLVEGTCDSCGLCSLVCPFGALSVGHGRVGCRPGACTACGLCVAVCPTGGLALRPLTVAAIQAAGRAAAQAGTPAPWRPDPSAPVASEASLGRRAALTDERIRASVRRPGGRTPAP